MCDYCNGYGTVADTLRGYDGQPVEHVFVSNLCNCAAKAAKQHETDEKKRQADFDAVQDYIYGGSYRKNMTTAQRQRDNQFLHGKYWEMGKD